jgi:hypothetical protein
MSLLKNLSAPIWATAVFVCLAILNPFGMRDATESESRNVFFSILAPLYSSYGSSAITVVLIDDQALNASGHTYPPAFSFYDRLLKNIGAYPPKAVFLDILLADKRGAPQDLDHLAATIRSLHEKGISVFTPVSLEIDASGLALERPVQALAELRRAASAEVHIQFLEDGQRIPLIIPASGQKRPYEAASLALLNVHRNDSALDDYTADLIVRWPENYPRNNDFTYQPAPDCIRQGTVRQNLERAARRFWLEFLPIQNHKKELQDQAGCWPQTTVPAELVYDLSYLKEIALEHKHPSPSQLPSDLFSDRIVMIGAEFSGQNDYGLSPVHGRISGIFVHAMALGNLLSYGDRYYKPWPDCCGQDSVIKFDTILEAILILLFASLAAHWKRKRHRCETPQSILLSGTLYAAFGLILTAAALVASVMSRYEPVNWIGLMTVGALLYRPVFTDSCVSIWRMSKARIFASIQSIQMK